MLQFIVLLSIMAIWALTSLLSREAQPLPPRPTRGPGPDGARPNLLGRRDTSGSSREAGAGSRTTRPLPDRRQTALWPDPASAPKAPAARAAMPEEGIVVSDSRQAAGAFGSGAAARGRITQVKRTGRGRASSSPGPNKTADPGRARALTSQVTESMAQKRNRPLEITPLSSPLSLDDTPLVKLSMRQSAERPRTVDAPPLTADTVRTMIASAGRLREIALLTEILQPPIALRSRRRLR